MSIYRAGAYTLVETPAAAIHIQTDCSTQALCGARVWRIRCAGVRCATAQDDRGTGPS